MMIGFLASLTLSAFASGAYHPSDIAAQSKVFAQASAELSKKFDAGSATADALAAALLDYELGLDLLGSRAPAAERERLDTLSREYNREAAKFRAFSDTLIDDFDGEFRAALARALVRRPDATECRRELPAGPPLPGMPARMKPNPDCQGDDLNPALAADIDADPALAKAIGEIQTLTWPLVNLTPAAQSPVGGSERFIRVAYFFRKAAPDALKQIEADDNEARLPFAAAMEQGASKEQLASMVEDARAITAETARRRASLAAPALAAADRILAKWREKGEPGTGWCANPTLLGGCSGMDDTTGLSEPLLAKKKVTRALP